MDILAVRLADDARTAAPLPQRQTSRRLRRTKLVAALAVTALVGVGSYTATYRALVIASTPASTAGSIAPIPSGGPHTVSTPFPPLP